MHHTKIKNNKKEGLRTDKSFLRPFKPYGEQISISLYNYYIQTSATNVAALAIEDSDLLNELATLTVDGVAFNEADYPANQDGNPKGLGRMFKNTLVSEFKKTETVPTYDYIKLFGKLCNDENLSSPFETDPIQTSFK